MALVEAAAGALFGAVAGGFATYFAERHLDGRRADREAAQRAQTLRDERDTAREWQSRSAAVEVLAVLDELGRVAGLLRTPPPGLDGWRESEQRTEEITTALRRVMQVASPQLTVLALREQLAEVVLLTQEYIYGQWPLLRPGRDTPANPAQADIKRNRGQVDLENFTAWTTLMFQSYVDGSWTTFTVEPRPVLVRDDAEAWQAPDEREDDGGPATV